MIATSWDAIYLEKRGFKCVGCRADIYLPYTPLTTATSRLFLPAGQGREAARVAGRDPRDEGLWGRRDAAR